ncbi:hypothetical protein HK103_007369 [Boothiomyces macroporosus]|uniref:Protein kinase domain-containing protein n=1 Tax=Boothiomyces macroporosus TaxID=261099 RepID=A0AAD5UKS3_9FUNG|nr:hypothetical protein HK103_007369 [Boothiomyces macroporosus]
MQLFCFIALIGIALADGNSTSVAHGPDGPPITTVQTTSTNNPPPPNPVATSNAPSPAITSQAPQQNTVGGSPQSSQVSQIAGFDLVNISTIDATNIPITMDTEDAFARRKSLVDTLNVPKGRLRKRSATMYQKRPENPATGSITNLDSAGVKVVDTKSFTVLEKLQTVYLMKKILAQTCVQKEAAGDECGERFILQSIDSPFTANLKFCFQDTHHIYQITEYSRINLRSVLQNGIKEANLQRYAAQISQGIAYLHNNFIIHRDINPDILLIDANGSVLISNFAHTMSTKYPILLPDSENNSYKTCMARYFLANKLPFEIKQGNTFELSFPKTNGITLAAITESANRQSFIKGLLEVDPNKRMGSSFGGLGFEKDVKQHPWLSLIEWDGLKSARTKLEGNYQSSLPLQSSNEFLNKLLTKVKTNINNVADSFSKMELPQDINMEQVKLLTSYMKDYNFESQENEKLDPVPEEQFRKRPALRVQTDIIDQEDICLGLQFTLKDAIREYIQLEEIENKLSAIQEEADRWEKEIQLLEAEIKGIENKLAYLNDKRIKNSPFPVETTLHNDCEKLKESLLLMDGELFKFESSLSLIMELVRAFSYKFNEIQRKQTDPDEKFTLGNHFVNFMINTYTKAREIQPKIPKVKCILNCKTLGHSKTLVGKIPQLKEYTKEELQNMMTELQNLLTNLSLLVKHKRGSHQQIKEIHDRKSQELEIERRKILRGLALGIDRQRALRTSIDTTASSLDLPPAYSQLPSPTPSYDDDTPLCQLFFNK